MINVLCLTCIPQEVCSLSLSVFLSACSTVRLYVFVFLSVDLSVYLYTAKEVGRGQRRTEKDRLKDRQKQNEKGGATTAKERKAVVLLCEM